MPEYVQSTDLELLRSTGFTAGWSGNSWFSPKDKEGNFYQCYPIDGDDKMTFAFSNDRSSVYMTLDDFKEKFNGAQRSGQ